MCGLTVKLMSPCGVCVVGDVVVAAVVVVAFVHKGTLGWSPGILCEACVCVCVC